MSRSTSTRGRSTVWPLLLAIFALVVYGVGWGGWFTAGEDSVLSGAEVRRGPLRISVVQRGNLESKNSISLKSRVEGQTTILYLIPEGTLVEPGDLIAELDASDLVEDRVAQEIAVQNAQASFTKAAQELEIQRSQNESDIAKALQAVEFAKSDLEKYREGDWPRKLQEAEESIVLAEEEKLRATERLNWSTELEKKGFLTRTELEGDRLSSKRTEILLEQAKRNKGLLIDFDHPKEQAVLVADLEEAKRELERVRLQARARIADYEVARETSEARLALQEEKLVKMVQQIKEARIVAPEAGMVVYGRQSGGRRSGDEPVQEGLQVRERQEIATIPRPGGMIVEASIHESVLKQVRVGQRCIVQIDAMPGHEFEGTVNIVAVLPDKNSWWANPNLRLYKTEIAITEGNEEMRPGMSCNIEIVIDDIEDTLFVPLQAVLRSEGETISFVQGPDGVERRSVVVGQRSDKWVEVLEGLDEGEIVMLSPPPGFVAAGAPTGNGGSNGEQEARPAGESGAKGESGGRPSGAGDAEGAGSRSGRGQADRRKGGTAAVETTDAKSRTSQ